VVLVQWGDFYNAGWQNGKSTSRAPLGYIAGGVRVSGRLSIRTIGKRSGDWLPGRIPSLPFGSDRSSRFSVVGWFESGLLRADLTSLSLSLTAERHDPDDIAFLHQHGWGVYRGFLRVRNWGTGVVFYGNSVGSISSGYISHNGVGVAFGDGEIGSDIVPGLGCLRDTNPTESRHCDMRPETANETALRDMVIEGNRYGNLVVFDGENLTFDSVHFETGRPSWQQGHSVLIGAGTCQAPSPRLGRPCGLDRDCEKGSCTFHGRSDRRRSLQR